MTNEEASIIVGNIPINGDGCYSIPEYQEAKAMAIEALDQQPCEDAISRQAVKEAICDYVCGKDIRCVANHECNMKKLISELPSVTPKEKTGYWVYKQGYFGVVYCSECDYELKTNNTNFCPNCGAKMQEVGE